MRKVTVAAVIIGVFIIYSLLYHQSNASALPPLASNNTRPATSVPTATPPIAASGTSPTSTTTPTHYKDGSYTGSVADAQWGYVQVKAVVKNGKIVDVQWVQYPNDRSRSIMINQYADPQLTSEAIQAQSAQVDIVTGATDSSMAFIQSLSDALTSAKA